MSEPISNLIDRLRPAVLPFERHNRNHPNHQKTVAIGEDIYFEKELILVDSIGLPGLVTVNLDDLDDLTDLNKDGRYLWIIDTEGRLYIILESTPNPAASRKCVCHSNMTGGKAALQGGELWFSSLSSIVLNFHSGRYGAETTEHEDAVVEYWELIGFSVRLQE